VRGEWLYIKIKMNEKEFQQRKKLIELEREKTREIHEYHLKEIELQIKLQTMKHEQTKEEMRIKSAEIRKSMERKENNRFMRTYNNE
jgi:hypothetical protein